MYESELLKEFAEWINNNWFIPFRDGNWVQDVKHEEYNRTIKESDKFIYTSQNLVDMFINGERRILKWN